MQNWHFNISAYVNVEGSSQTMNIHPENFRDLIKISDYRNENMPKYMAHLALDKNLYDIIVANAKTATIHLKIEKFDKQSDTQTPMSYPYIEDDFCVYVSKDINYNKELDYKESEVLREKKREDVYREVDIGLISKSAIDANKVLACGTMYKSTMMNIAAYFLMNTHLLIEPFKYNSEQEQLIIPPLETMVKTIAFLNEVKVFYDTQYLFFIDEPSCTYLISRSGMGVEKSDEQFNDVFFEIHQKDDEAAATPGMMTDTDNNRYHVDFNVANTRFTIDHDTVKIINKYKDIVNPNKDNVQSTLTTIEDAFNSVTSIVDDVKSLAQNFNSSNPNIANDLFNWKRDVTWKTTDTNEGLPPYINSNLSCIDQTISILNSLPTTISTGSSGSSSSGGGSSTVQVISSSDRTALINSLNTDKTEMITNYNQTVALSNSFSDTVDYTSDVVYSGTKADNYVGALSPVNAQNGVDNTKKYINNLGTSSNELSSKSHFLDSCIHYPSDMNKNCSDAKTTIDKIVQKLKSIVNSYSSSPQISVIKTALNNMESIQSTMGSNNSKIGNLVSDGHSGIVDIIGGDNNFGSIPSMVSTTVEKMKSVRSNLDSISKMNVKAKFKSITMDLRTIGTTATGLLNKIKSMKNMSIGFSFGDLSSFKENINAISDLTGLGKLGVSSIETDLLLGSKSKSIKSGYHIVKTENDNENKLKNEQTELQNMANQLTVNKYDLDPSVFTPNKKYTVRNYNGHRGIDGIFLLNKKIEVYVREDTTFRGLTVLDMCKKIDTADTDTGTGAEDKQTTENTEESKEPTVLNNWYSSYFADNGSMSSNTGKVLGSSSIMDAISAIDKFVK